MIKNFFDKVESTEITIKDWLIGFVCIIFVRFILESISSPAPSGMMPTDPYTLVHYGLFFLAVTLGLVFFTGYFTKKYTDSSKIILFILPILWIAPIIDILTGKVGQSMSYIYAFPKDLVMKFILFPFFVTVNGITLGMRVQIIILFGIVAYYIWLKTKKYTNVILGLISIYVFMFILGSIPSLLYAIGNTDISKTNSLQISYYLEKTILNSNIIHNTLHEGVFSVTRYRFFQLGFDKLMSQILFTISILLTFLLFWKIDRQKMVSVFRNSRPIRIVYYLLPFMIGVLYALSNKLNTLYSWVDMLGITILFISWFGMWMYSVHLNDIYDKEIDEIANKNRPLSTKTVDVFTMNDSSYIFLLMSIIGAWCAGFYSFFFISVGLCVAYIYSVPPLRLRRFPIVSSFLISVVMLCATLSGFFFTSIDKSIDLFSPLLCIGIIIFYTLQINFKDIKDIEGDRKHGVTTIPNYFKNGVKITGLLFSLSFLITPVFIKVYSLYLISIPLAIIGYFFATSKIYNEKKMFATQFMFLIIFIVFMFIRV